MKDFDNRVAAITGAASGIGRAVALGLADEGCHLALCDVDSDGLETTATLARAKGVEVETALVDVASRREVHAWADHVAEYFGRVHIVVNNAGVSLSASVEAMDYDDLEWLMNINFWGVVHGTKAFLPHLRSSGEGHVVNVSSIFGIIGVPTQSAYNASKFAVRGFTEALRAELEVEGAPISATTVHPGGVKTNIVRSSRVSSAGPLGRQVEDLIREFDEELARLTPDDAARQILDALRENRRRVLVGGDAKLIVLIQRISPTGYLGGLARVFRRRMG